MAVVYHCVSVIICSQELRAIKNILVLFLFFCRKNSSIHTVVNTVQRQGHNSIPVQLLIL